MEQHLLSLTQTSSQWSIPSFTNPKWAHMYVHTIISLCKNLSTSIFTRMQPTKAWDLWSVPGSPATSITCDLCVSFVDIYSQKCRHCWIYICYMVCALYTTRLLSYTATACTGSQPLREGDSRKVDNISPGDKTAISSVSSEMLLKNFLDKPWLAV